MIATLGLHDVIDAEGFVARCMLNSGIRFGDDEKDEMLAEGLAILCDLARRFEPHRPGYERPGSFAGYAAQLLPRRMHDAYVAQHPEHRARRADGRRTYTYGEQPLSLHADDAPIVATTAVDQTLHLHEHADTDITRLPLVASAMSLLGAHERLVARPMLGLIFDGLETDQIAQHLGMTRGHVTRTHRAIEIAVRQATTDALETDAA